MTGIKIIEILIETIKLFMGSFIGTTWAVFKGAINLKNSISTFQDIVNIMLIPLSILALATGIIRQIVKRSK